MIQFPCMLSQSATITSKMQLTIPMRIANKLGIKSGEKVHVSERDGQIVITPLRQLVEELAGSIHVPIELKHRDIDEVIQEAKEQYFHSKYTSKKV